MVDTSDTSELHIQIPQDVGKAVDFNPHKGKPASIIACSPNGKYIATWCFEDRSVVGWKIVDGELQLKHEYMISVDNTIYNKCSKLYVHEGIDIDLYKHKDNIHRHLKQNYSSFVSVSDNLLVSMAIYEIYESESLFLFSKFKIELIHKSTIKLDTIENIDYISITIAGKIFIYNTSIGNITKWDIMTLKLEAYFLFKPECYDNREIKLSDDELLLFVHTYDKQIKIDAVYLIASKIGARLLIIAYNEEDKSEIYNLRDPFTFTEPVDAHKFFDHSEDSDMQIQIQYPFIVKSDKIIGINDENIDKKLIIKELIQDKNNWITFLRKTLGDFNRIYMSSIKEQIIKFLEENRMDYGLRSDIEAFMSVTEQIDSKLKIFDALTGKAVKTEMAINEATNKKPDADDAKVILSESFEKNLVKWTLQCYKTSDILLAKHLKTEKACSICINACLDLDSIKAQFVISCCCLDNDALVMLTVGRVFIWTFSTKKDILLIYTWCFDSNYEIISYFKNADYFLPPPQYIYGESAFTQQDETKRFFFSEMVDEHINNEFFLILYGKDIINENKDSLLQKLCSSSLKYTFESAE
ncbi:14647_t:CDS:2, partial [Racocetra fulgida]